MRQKLHDWYLIACFWRRRTTKTVVNPYTKSSEETTRVFPFGYCYNHTQSAVRFSWWDWKIFASATATWTPPKIEEMVMGELWRKTEANTCSSEKRGRRVYQPKHVGGYKRVLHGVLWGKAGNAFAKQVTGQSNLYRTIDFQETWIWKQIFSVWMLSSLHQYML